MFDRRMIRSTRFPTWVISIGNLSVGGTGKSPHVEYMARVLEGMNNKYKGLHMPLNKMAIVSRGYGRTTTGFVMVNETSDAGQVGDEPLQLKRRLKEVYVAVDEDRVHGINTLLEKNRWIHLVILDDAFQHRYVKSDLSILLTNYNFPFYKDYMLPFGRLREPRSGYKRARFIFVTDTPPNISEGEKKQIIDKINPGYKQKVFFSSIFYQDLLPVFKNTPDAPPIDKATSVVLFTGIANPQSLYAHLNATAKEVTHIVFPDHHIFQPDDITKVVNAYNATLNPNKLIVTTEKDAMRLETGNLINSFGHTPVFYLPIQVKVDADERLEDSIISKLSPPSFARMVSNKAMVNKIAEQ
jgi:tetraacyldisaccharide 4'-kinase